MHLSGGDKTIVLYLDVLFGINFLMDFIVIFIVNKICKYAATFVQVLLSATLGAVWSVIAVMLPDNIQMLVHICTYIFISFLMVKICALNNKFRDVLKGMVTLYGVTFVLAGAIHMLYYYTYAGYIVKQIIMGNVELLIFILISLILLYLVYVQYVRLKVYGDKTCSVVVKVSGREVTLTGYIDTGNVLIDPYNQKPVSVAQKALFQDILNQINDYTEVKYHLVPFNSVGCENGLLEVITVDNMYIYSGKEVINIENALIGLTDVKLSSDEEFQMLINAGLL